MDKEDMEYVIKRLESAIELMKTSKHMAVVRLLSIISLLKGRIEDMEE